MISLELLNGGPDIPCVSGVYPAFLCGRSHRTCFSFKQIVQLFEYEMSMID